MRRRYRPLRFTVPAMFFVAGALLLSLYFLNELRSVDGRLHRNGERDLRGLATVSAGDMEAAFRLDERSKARAAVERLAGIRQIARAMLVNSDGLIVYATDAELADRPVAETGQTGALFNQASSGGEAVVEHRQNPDSVAGAFPVHMRTNPETFLPGETGWLLIDMDLSREAARLHREMSRRILPYAVALVAICILLWLVFRSVLLKRIARLTISTRKLAKGDFSDRPDLGEGDELADLAAEFRTMADHLQRHTEELDFLSNHDGLTGLLNRRGFENHLDNVMAHLSHSGGGYLLCYLDIDGFRVINDTQGHAAGDSLLREIAARLRRGFTPDTAVARLAGDEFAVLLPDDGQRDPYGAAADIEALIAEFRFEWESETFRVAFNIGVVRVDRETESAERALSLADAACYAAKASAHTRIRYWDPEESDLLEHHGEMHWVSRIQSALDQDRFELYAQPIHPARGGGRLRLELLLRMRDANGSVIRPDRFLPAAEHYGLVSQIDRWVLDRAFAFFREHPEFQEKLGLCAINLSALSLGNTDLVELVARELGKNGGLRPEQLCFEVTETAAVTNLTVASGFMSELRRLGCRFALDDFGSGVSSFGYLKNLEVDFIKIDGVFVRGALSDRTDRTIVQSINDIAHEMGKETVAEFVESRELAREMRRIGIDYLQGNGLAKTRPLRSILESQRSAGR